MKAAGHSYRQYFAGTSKLHAIGILGGVIWMIAFCLNVIASGVAGPAVSYGLGQGATLVAAIWGVVIWKEFQAAPKGTMPFRLPDVCRLRSRADLDWISDVLGAIRLLSRRHTAWNHASRHKPAHR